MKRLIKISVLALMVVLAMTGCKKSYTITVKSNNDAWGSVTGSGTYKDGEIATISAVPAAGYYFNCWNDGNTENPRKIEVSGNAEYIATFSDTPGGSGGTDNAIEVSGSISSNTTWADRGAGVDYIIDGRFWVEGNALLTIQPGVTIMFTGVDGSIVLGENAGLRMVGTADKPIVFTGPTNNPNKGSWGYVEILSNRADNQFEYVFFNNGGYESPVVVNNGKLSMKHCTINGSLENGFVSDGTLSAFENNTIKNVDQYPVVFGNYQLLNALGNGNTYTNNRHNMIKLDCYWFNNEGIYETIKFRNQGIPYYAPQGMNLQATQDVMRVYEGVEIVFGSNTGIYVGENGLIEVQGTESAPVIFRGEQNENGFWDGIEYASQRTAGSKLVNVTIKNAGKYDEAALRLNEESYFTLNNVTINGSNGYGMRISIPVNWDTEQYDFANYHVTASGLTFANCAQGNIYETNKDQVLSTWPGNKKLARK